MFTFAAGRPLSGRPFDPELWQTVGSELARMHGAMDAFSSANSRYHLDLTMLVDMPLAEIRPYVTAAEEKAYAELTELAQGLKAAVSNGTWDPGTYGLIHADTHDGNIHVAPDGSFTLFDFDHCGYGWRAYDLMPYYRPPTAENEKEIQKSEAFLGGYDAIRGITATERDLFPVFRACRALWDIGDWLRAAAWTGNAWALDGICDRALTRVREPLGGD
ncbi:MAG TPA: phosphotransferase [Mycobacteriales bacterium]|nr:phosphotransferase [Mycobacteriales bacterium]